MPNNSKGRATVEESTTTESSSKNGFRGFFRKLDPRIPEPTALEPEELRDFEQEIWDWFGLVGPLDHTYLLEECQVRVQKGDRDAAEVLEILHKISRVRHLERARWPVFPNPLARGGDPQEGTSDLRIRGTLRSPLWALLIGNDKYPQNPLYGAVNDSKDWKSYLIDFLGVPESNITHFENADRRTMVTALYNLRDNPNIKPGDQILFTYSGHGASYDATVYSFEEDHQRAGSIEALCPVDRGLRSNGSPVPDISDREVCVLLSEIYNQTGAKITVFFDCCHSGGGVREWQANLQYPRRVGALVDKETIRAMFLDADNDQRRRSTTSVRSPTWAADARNLYRPVLLAACQDTELAREENGHGLFTAAVMRVLRSEKGRGLTCSGLIKAIGALRSDQKPRFDGEDRVLFL